MARDFPAISANSRLGSAERMSVAEETIVSKS